MESSFSKTPPRSRVVLCGVTVAALCLGCVESAPRPQEGAKLYAAYCASCHGVSGRGDGSVGAALATPPPDLTRIAPRNDGQFDESMVLSAIDGRYEIAAHGPREMPVWGAVFRGEHRDDPFPVHRGMDDARALVDFLRTLQQVDGESEAPTPGTAESLVIPYTD